MRIVILDGHAVNPGDLDWGQVQALGECVIHPRTRPEELEPRARDAEILLTNKTVIGRDMIARLPRLRYVGVLATGYNVVDLGACRERKIPVTNIPAYGTMSVCQTVFSLLLEITHGVGRHNDWVKRGGWAGHPDFCYWDFPLIELDGLTLGLFGFGNIARKVCLAGQAFGMNVIAHTRTPRPAEFPAVEFVGLDDLFSRSDVVSLHAPLTDETAKIVNLRTLGLMKSSAILINTGRGGLVDEPALASALSSGRIAAAGVDVLSSEPPAGDNPLLAVNNCLITPHLGWGTVAARRRLMTIAAANIRSFLDGGSLNAVN